MDMPDDKARFIENMEFTFDDGGNIQQKDELYILSPEVFPYYLLSKLTDFIVSQRIVIKPWPGIAGLLFIAKLIKNRLSAQEALTFLLK